MRTGSRLCGALCLLWLMSAAAPRARAQADTTSVPAAATATETPAPDPASAEAPAAAGAPSGNAMNPNLSVIGWLQASGGPTPAGQPAFHAREAEIGLQSVVDPYARADFFLSASEAGGLDLEEGYITFTQLPAGLGLKAGKFRNKLAKLNQTHAGETPFADRPLAAARFFGDEGLSSTGLSASYLVPLPVYVNLELEATTPPPVDAGGVFARTSHHNQLQYLGRLSVFQDLGDAANVNLSGTFATAPASPSFVGPGDTYDSRAKVWAGELTFRWKNPTRAIYHSLIWQTEVYRVLADRDAQPAVAESPDSVAAAFHAAATGLFSYVDYQFARRYHAGVRFDLAGQLGPAGHDTGELAYVTLTPSEFSSLSLQARHVRTADGQDTWNEFLKLTFNIGPHGAHPF